MNIDDFDERPNGSFDETERVSEVGVAGRKAMVKGRGARGRWSGRRQRQRPGREGFSEGQSDTKRGRGDCR